MAKAPCKGCPDRVVNCHSTCTKYQEFRKQQDAENEAQRKSLCEHFVIHKGSWTGDSGFRRGRKKR